MDFRKQCPLCNSNKYEILEKKSITNNKLSSFLEKNYKLGEYLKDIKYFYELRYCSKCGTRYQVNFLNEEETNKLYSNSIKPQKSFLKQVVNYNKNLKTRKKTARFLKELFKYDNSKVYKALEVGAGWGFFAHICKEYNFDFTTIEISDERKRFHDFLELKINDSFKHAIKSGTKYDLIYSNQVLEHIGDLYSFMENCNNLLANNGYFVAEYPSYNQLVHYLFKRNNYFNDKRTKALEHLQLISDKGIEKLIKNIGTLKYLDKFPIRRSGDRIRYFFQFLTPSKFKGTGFLIAQKIK